MSEIICRCGHEADEHKRIAKKDPVSIAPCTHKGCDCADLRYAVARES